MSEDKEFNDALNHLRMISSTWRSFKMMEDVLVSAAKARETLNSLNSQIENARDTLERTNKATADKLYTGLNEYKKLEDKYATRRKEIEENLDALEKNLLANQTYVNDEIETLKNRLASEKREFAAAKAILDNELSVARANIDEAKKSLSNLVGSIQSKL